MTGLLREVTFEDELVGHLIGHGSWLLGNPGQYDRSLALYPEDVIGWLKETQPGEYAKVKGATQDDIDRTVLSRLAAVIEEQGTLKTLRQGFKRINARFDMCAFRPGHGLNTKMLELYSKVRCRVVRQVHYSQNNENSIDLVLFVNGIPVATLELKTDLTQSIDDAVTQYKKDRLPKDPKTGKPEPLLTFQRGALVHFAVSTDEVRMTTKLQGSQTVFLPFNLGINGAAGNPPNPNGFKTSYLWEKILQRDAWLEILEKYFYVANETEEDANGKKIVVPQLIFPRYHQWDAVRKTVEKAASEGPGHKYLEAHSAGSGKSATIMWLAHQLSNLHNSTNKKVFDSVIVVTDRQVLDNQLKDAIFQLDHKDGVVVHITKEGAKSPQLFEALKKHTPIIIVTIQTFPYAIESIAELPDMADRSFAVIADEAHSSQTGEAAKKLREALGIVPDEGEGEEIAAEDVVAAELAKLKKDSAKRAGAQNISFFAFTATPKPKTIELFGRPRADGVPVPFHEYTMQQAIEEGFILDVLQNFTPYNVAYILAITDEKNGDTVVPKSEAAKLIARYAKLHPANIAEKVEIIVEHFRTTVSPLLGGKAKAMIVCDSRKAAVAFKLAMNEYIANKAYGIGTLVAFSDEVKDETKWPGQSFTEVNMNKLSGQSIPNAFKTDAYQILIVAEKYQTGFNQPLLSAMYVDKKLSGIAAVQTLSRLNRTYERNGVKKDETFVLDFVNTDDEILAAFKPYYKEARLAGVTDPDQIHRLQATLDSAGVYGQSDVDAYFVAYAKAQAANKGAQRQSLVKAVLDPIVDRFHEAVKKAEAAGDTQAVQRAEIFRRDIASFVRLYAFLSQIYDYEDTELEKRSLLFSALVRLLKDDTDDVPVDVSNVEMTHHNITKGQSRKLDLNSGGTALLKPISDLGTAKVHDIQYGPLAEVVKAINDVLGTGIQDEHQLKFVKYFAEKLVQNETLKEQALNNSLEEFKNAGDVKRISDETLVEARDEIITDNERENESVSEAVSRLFGDKDGLARLEEASATYVYEYHRREQGTVANDDTE